MKPYYLLILGLIILSCDPPAKEPESDDQSIDQLQYEMERFYSSYQDCEMENERCTYMEVTYPIFSLSKQLNDFIDSIKSPAFDPDQRMLPLQNLADDFIQNYAQFIEEYPESSQAWFMKHTLKVDRESDSLILLSAELEEYGGGAHGNYTINYYNLDKSTGQALKLTDLYSQEEIDRMTTIMSISINPEITLLTESIAPNNNFLLSADSITFVYNPYEIAPYSEGIIQLTLPRDQSPIM